MTNMNGKVFIHNKTGNRYFVLNEATDSTNKRDGVPVVVYTRIDNTDTDWYVREYYEFLEKFTEKC